MENLDTLIHLDTLNLSNNMIRKIEGLNNLQSLTTLLLANNKLISAEDIAELLCSAATLSVLDLSQNLLDDAEGVIRTLAQLPNLRVLYLKGNPFVSKMPAYRKTLISTIATLKYLDDRPVFPDERSCAEAWARGGRDAEIAERAALRQAREADERRRAESFEEMLHKVHQGECQEGDDADEDGDLFDNLQTGYQYEVDADDEDGGDELPDLQIVGLKINSCQQEGELVPIADLI